MSSKFLIMRSTFQDICFMSIWQLMPLYVFGRNYNKKVLTQEYFKKEVLRYQSIMKKFKNFQINLWKSIQKNWNFSSVMESSFNTLFIMNMMRWSAIEKPKWSIKVKLTKKLPQCPSMSRQYSERIHAQQ
jgi:hypothetical protein